MTDDGLDALLATLILRCPGGTGARVPYGLAFALPQADRDGDRLTVYVASQGGRMRVVDDGRTMPLLEAAVDAPVLAATIDAVHRAGFVYDTTECELQSLWLAPDEIPEATRRLAELIQTVARQMNGEDAA